MLPATQEPGQEPALGGPLAPFPAGSRAGDPSIPDRTIPPCPEGCKHINQSSIPSLSPSSLPWAVRARSVPLELCWGHSGGAVTRRAPGSAQPVPGAAWPSPGKAGLAHLTPRLLAPAALARGCKSVRGARQRQTRRFPAAGQPRRLWHSPLPPARGCQQQWSITSKRRSQDFPARMAEARWSGMPC